VQIQVSLKSDKNNGYFTWRRAQTRPSVTSYIACLVYVHFCISFYSA